MSDKSKSSKSSKPPGLAQKRRAASQPARGGRAGVFLLVARKPPSVCSPVKACADGDCESAYSMPDLTSAAASVQAAGAVASTAMSAARSLNAALAGPQVSRLRISRTRDIAAGATAYFGPIGPTDGLEMYAIQIATIVANITNGAGQLTTVFTTDPSVAGDWASYAAIFDEYRVLGMRIEYQPINRYAPVASPGSITNQGPFYNVIDYDDTNALSSLVGAANFSGSIEAKNTSDPWSRTVRMSGGPDDNWVTTATPAATFSIKTYAQDLAATFTYGRTLQRLLVQFRTTD